MRDTLPKVLTKEQIQQIINTANQEHHKLAYKLGFYCCLRISEVTNLKPNDIDKQGRRLHVQDSKNSKDRYVIIPKPIKLPTLEKQLPLEIGERALQRAFKRHARDVTDKDVSFHTLRHSGATHSLKNGMDIRSLQDKLGHANLETTRVYTHISLDDRREQVDEVFKE